MSETDMSDAEMLLRKWIGGHLTEASLPSKPATLLDKALRSAERRGLVRAIILVDAMTRAAALAQIGATLQAERLRHGAQREALHDAGNAIRLERQS